MANSGAPRSTVENSTLRFSRGRRISYRALLLVGLALFAELVSYGALWVRDGAVPNWRRWREDRQRATGASAVGSPEGRPAAPRFERSERPERGAEALHPYLGYVLDPGVPPAPDWPPAGTRGFREGPEPEASSDPSRVRIAIFGGSVAEGFAYSGARALTRELERAPAWSGRSFQVVNYAIPGYKQPQPLIALNYFLALGDRMDLVILLDGFNEIVLPLAENLPNGVNPFYPRDWAQRLSGLPDLESEMTAGELAYLRTVRTERARWCAGRLLSRSASCELLWSTFDRRLNGRAVAVAERLKRTDTRGSFAASGPRWEAPDSPADRYQDLAAFWARSSAQMFALCQGRGIPYFHFLQPNQYVSGSKPMGRAEALVAIDERGGYTPFARAGYPYLIDAGRGLAKEGVPFFDLTPVFAREARAVYADGCCHLNELGDDLLGTAIGREIATRLAGGRAP